MACSRKLKLILVSSEYLEASAMLTAPAEYHKAWHLLHTAKGVIVPGGFGERGTSGMLAAIESCRVNGTPFLGICLGMQLAVIEYARNVCKISNAQSEEFEKEAEEQVVIFMPEGDKNVKGGTMRLGLRSSYFQAGSEFSKLRKLYRGNFAQSASVGGSSNGDLSRDILSKTNTSSQTIEQQSSSVPITPLTVNERHRHRYEVNPKYVDRLSKAGLHFVARDETGQRMEIFELQHHPWFVGVQFHPEYLSRVLEPSKPYLGVSQSFINIRRIS